MMLDRLRQDVRYAVRSLAGAPGFAAAVVLTVALGVGAAAAVFSVVDGVLLRPLPVAEQKRLLVVWKAAPERGMERVPFSFQSYEALRERLRTTAGVAAHAYAGTWTAALQRGEDALPLQVAPVTGEWFDVLGVRPAAGRLLRAEDDHFGAAPVLVLSSGLATRLFGGSAAALGGTVRVDDAVYTVIGVAPAGFAFPAAAEAWVAATPFILAREGGASLREAGRVAWELAVRVAPGATPEQVRAELGVALAALETEPAELGTQLIRAPDFGDVVVGDVRLALRMLAVAVLLVLVIAGLNVANLLLVRGVSRQRELAVRAAIGASRGRVLRQLATEAALLVAAGAALAVTVAHGALRLLLALAPPELPRLTEVGIDGRALVFTAVAAAAAALLFGVLPAVRTTRAGAVAALRARGGGFEPGSRGWGLRHGLVVGQVALTTLVLATAGLLLRSLDQMQRLDLGYAAEEVLLAEIALPALRYPDAPAQQRALARLAEHAAALPGVQNATALVAAPLAGGRGADIVVYAEGQALDEAANPLINYEGADAAHFATLGLPIVRGRALLPHDRAETEPVVVVNEAFARLYWPGQEAVGRRIKWGRADSPTAWRTVVGVAADARYRELVEARPSVYVPWEQGIPVTPRYLAVRTDNAAAVAAPLRQTVAREEPGASLTDIAPLPGLLAAPLARPRFQSALVGAFALFGLVLSVIGTYGVLAFFVRQRRRELGIRVALGAKPVDVAALVLRQGLAIGGAGVLIGVAGALATGRLIESLLFGVDAADPLVLAATALTLLAASAAATLVPSRSAARTDAMVVLRSE